MGCSSSSIRQSVDGLTEKTFANKTNKELVDTIKFLRGVPTFSVLQPREYPLLAAACVKQVYRKGEVIMNGLGSSEFVLVRRGEASVWMDHPCCTTPGLPPSPHRTGGRPSVKSASGSSANGTGSEGWASKSSLDSARAGAHHFVPPTARSSMRSRDGPVRVATLRSKDYFGESALMGGEEWDMTIVVESQEMEVIKIHSEKFERLKLSAKLRIPKRERVYLSTTRADFLGVKEDKGKPRDKDDVQRNLIRTALTSRAALNVYIELHEGIIEKLVDVAWKKELAEHQVLVQPQADQSPCMYVVQDGRLLMVHRKDRDGEKEPASSRIAARRTSFFCSESEERGVGPEISQGSHGSGSTIGPGSCYGECTLMYDTVHLAQVLAKQRTTVWVIDQNDFALAARLSHQEKHERYIEFLEVVPLFSALLSDEKLMIARTLVDQTWTCGQEIYRQGEVNQTFTILTEGEVVVIKDGVEEKRLSVNPGVKGPVRHFGEHSLTQSLPHTTTVRVSSTKATTLALGRDALEVLLGPVNNLLQQLHNDQPVSPATPHTPARMRGRDEDWPASARLSKITVGSNSMSGFRSIDSPQTFRPIVSKVRLDNLRKLRLLGRGGFGMVELVEDMTTQALYALKTVLKARVGKTEFLKTQILNEKYILEMTGSRFIIKLFSTEKTAQELYFILEPALGGELLATYRRRKLFGDEDHARYYAASVIYAFEHLHERHIIYRDLKPENLMLDHAGHLKLTDMGLAKFVVGKTFTVCGTPVYFAPEVAKQSGYNRAVDWWQLGILVWELLTGRTPFPANTRGEAFYWLFTEKVLMTLSQPSHPWPTKIPDKSKEFLKAVLDYDPSGRVPMLPNGSILIRENVWFEGFPWMELVAGKMEAPYKPPKWNPRDTTRSNENFCDNTLVVRREEFYEDDGTDWDTDF